MPEKSHRKTGLSLIITYSYICSHIIHAVHRQLLFALTAFGTRKKKEHSVVINSIDFNIFINKFSIDICDLYSNSIHSQHHTISKQWIFHIIDNQHRSSGSREKKSVVVVQHPEDIIIENYSNVETKTRKRLLRVSKHVAIRIFPGILYTTCPVSANRSKLSMLQSIWQ